MNSRSNILIRTLTSASLMLAASTGLAQPSYTADPDTMMQLQQRAMEAQTCLADISEDDINALQAEANAFEKMLRDLCAAGKRSEAQSKAIQYGLKLKDHPTLTRLRQCSEGLTGMMQSMMPPMPQNDYDDLDDRHVCD